MYATARRARRCRPPRRLRPTIRACSSLAQEEKIRAREAELDHISAQAELGTQDGRAKRTRKVVTEQRQHKREKHTPDRTDPRERISRMELAQVNQEADRIAQRLRTDHSRADSISSGGSTFARSVERSPSSVTDSVAGNRIYLVVAESVPAFSHPRV